MKLSEMTRILLGLLIVTMVGCESRKNFTNTSYDVFRYEECPPIDCSLNSNRMCTTDENGCAVYVEDLTLTNVDVHATDKAVEESKHAWSVDIKNYPMVTAYNCYLDDKGNYPCEGIEIKQSKTQEWREKIFVRAEMNTGEIKYVLCDVIEKNGFMWLIEYETNVGNKEQEWMNSKKSDWVPYK